MAFIYSDSLLLPTWTALYLQKGWVDFKTTGPEALTRKKQLIIVHYFSRSALIYFFKSILNEKTDKSKGGVKCPWKRHQVIVEKKKLLRPLGKNLLNLLSN